MVPEAGSNLELLSGKVRKLVLAEGELGVSLAHTSPVARGQDTPRKSTDPVPAGGAHLEALHKSPLLH